MASTGKQNMSEALNSEKHKHYPINIDVTDSRVLFVGGGKATLLESQKLLECGAQVDIFAPRPIIEVRQLSVTYGQRVRVKKESYDGLKSESMNLSEYCLVFAYSSNHSVNERLKILCNSKGVLCTTLNSKGDFVVPSFFRRGHLKVCVSTDGISRSLEEVLLSKFEAEALNEIDDLALYLESIQEIVSELPIPLTTREKNKMNELVHKLSKNDEVSTALRRGNFQEAIKLFKFNLNLMMEESNLDKVRESIEVAE